MKLTTDELQFGFQLANNVQLGVNSVVDYYNRAGRAVYACAMNLSMAFDLVLWEVLFLELLERGVSPLALRCLFTQVKNVMLDGVMLSQIPSMEQFFPCVILYTVNTLTKLSSYYAIQLLDAKSRVSIWASGYTQIISFCCLLAEQVFRKWRNF